MTDTLANAPAADAPILASERAAFELPRDVVWMNAAQMSAMHVSVRKAGEAAVLRKREPWNSPPVSFFTEVDQARGLFSRLIGAQPSDVAIVPACSYGIATAAQNLEIAAGERIVVVEEQFPSNVYAWMRKAEETGATLTTAKRAADGAITGPLIEAIDASTRIVACGAVHWSDATPIDLLAVAKRCREVGAALVLDLTQSLGAVPFDIAEIDPDFVACPCYKWLLGPYTYGFLYAAPRQQQGKPLEETWMNRANARDFSTLVAYSPDYAPNAQRYDMGEKAHFTLAPMAIAALELLLAWTPERIAASLNAVNDRLASALAERGFEPPAPHLRSPHYFGLRLPAHAPADLAARLAAEMVYVSVRGAKMRISPHLWIDEEDEAAFLSAVDRNLG